MKKHTLIMLLCCLVPVVAMAAIVFFKVPISSAIWFGIILICPLSHILMMNFMMQDEHDHSSHRMKSKGRERLDLTSNLPAEQSYGRRSQEY